MSNYVVTELGIKAFVEANRVDFILQTPGIDKAEFPRVSAYANNPNAELKLSGKVFRIVEIHSDPVTGAAKQIEVTFGRRKSIKLGRCTTASGSPSFYRGLESSNNKPLKTEAELSNVLGAFGAKPAPTPDLDDDDDIPF
jgi:hypothetical protein